MFADEQTLQSRLCDRENLTRFEKGNQSANELQYMSLGIETLKKTKVNILNISNQDNFDKNVDKIVSEILRLLEEK